MRAIGIGIGIGFPAAVTGGGGFTPANFQSVNSDGWSTTYSSPTVASPEAFTAARQGYVGVTASTITEDLYATTRIRQPYPNQGTLTVDQVALSDYIYSADTIENVTNNSTATSPKPVANWVLSDFKVVGDTLVAEVVAFHRDARALEQVAAVEFTASDGSATASQVVTTSAVSGRAGDQSPVVVYKSSLDISGLADPATITLNAKVYPHIGGSASILDSADQSDRREFSPRTYRRDTALAAAPVLAYVDASGNDTTGAVSSTAATASASPCATIPGAIARLEAVNGRLDGCEIRCKAGTHGLDYGTFVATRTQEYADLKITRDPTLAVGDVTLQFGASSARYRIGSGGSWITVEGVTVSRTGTNGFRGESASQMEVRMVDCDFDNTNRSAPIINSNGSAEYYGTAFSNLGAATLNAGTFEVRKLRGCTGSPTSNIEGWLVVGCEWDQMAGSLVRGARSDSGMIVAFNNFTDYDPAEILIDVGDDSDVVGVAIVQNLFEYTSATSESVLKVSADSATGDNTHMIVHHNTFAGFFANGRNNLFYDDGATARASTLMSVKANIHVQINTKGDVFTSDGTRLGNRAYTYGVGCVGEFSQFIDANSGGIGGSFAQAYPGRSADIGTSATVRNDPLFADDQATSSGPTAGAGGGDYSLQSASPAKGIAPALVRFDASGAVRSATTSAGAYE